MPRLKAFYEEHPELRDKFEILALHESHTIKSLKELDVKNAKTEQDIWHGPLPFPVLIDNEGRTVARYDVSAYPTTILIDPQGRIVKGGSLELLMLKLGIKADAAGK